MAAIQGIVSPLCNPDNGAVIGDAWASSIRAISTKLAFVRASLAPDAQGHVPVDLYRQGIQALSGVGLDTWPVLEWSLGFNPDKPDLNPNDTLGFQGNPFLNEYTNAWTLNACSVANQLGLTTAWAGNEPNVQAALNYDAHQVPIPALKMGDMADPRKPGALDPRVYFGALYQLGLRARKLAPRLVNLIPASLSILVSFHTGQYDAWVGGYIDEGMQYLVDNRAKPPWPWSGLSANLEGAVDAKYAAYTMFGFARHKADHGITGPTYCGEWGVPSGDPAHPLDTGVMTDCFRNLSGNVYAMALFAFQCLQPGNESSYGCMDYTFQNGLFVPKTPTRWYSFAQSLLA